MLIYRLENIIGNGPIGHDNLDIDDTLRAYWDKRLDRIEPDGEPATLGAIIQCTTQDTACFGCRSIVELKRYWGKLYNVYLTRGLTPAVYEVPDYLVSHGKIQVCFPRCYHHSPVRVDDWPIIKEA